MAELIEKKLQPEIGSSGKTLNFTSLDSSAEVDLTFPESIDTYDKMARTSVIGATLAAVKTISCQVDFEVESYDQTDTHKKRAEFLRTCLFEDMIGGFKSFLIDALTMSQYGFSVLEKVYRYRRLSEGSKYNDGFVGIKYLPLRDAHSIKKFDFGDSNRVLESIVQTQVDRKNLSTSDLVLPANRVLFFRVNGSSGTPIGWSPLNYAYKPWQKLEKLQDVEANSANRNLNGIPHMSCPSEVMDEDEDDPESLERVKKLKKGLSRFASGEQAYVLTPSDRYDQTEGGGPQYEFKLVTGSSSHLTALNNIIQRYNNEVFQTMCADILTMDNGNGGGSSNLTTNKQTMLNMFVEARINEILDLVNTDLIPDLWNWNGWDTSKCPKLKMGRIEKLTVAELAKAIQQLMATKSIPITVDNINHIMEVFGFPERLPADMTRNELLEVLAFDNGASSGSGEGYARGTVGTGTATTVPAGT